MGEFLESFIEHFKSRFSNVLVTAFFISWAAINWELMLIVFSNLQVQEKIIFINNYLFISGIWKLLLLPLFSTIVFPWLAALLRIYNTWSQGKSRRALYKAASVDVVPSEKVNELLDKKQATILEGLQKINELYTDVRVERERAIHAESVIAGNREAELNNRDKILSLERMLRDSEASRDEGSTQIHQLKQALANESSDLKEEKSIREMREFDWQQLSLVMSRLVKDQIMMDALLNRYGSDFTSALEARFK